MAKLTQEAQALFNTVDNVVFGTADAQGQPNTCIVGMKTIIDDETVYLSDQFFKKTLANIQENQKCSIVFWKDHNAYQIHGTVRYVNEGPEFEEQAERVNALFKKMGKPITAKGGCFVTVDALYSSAAGPKAGLQIC